MAFSFNILMLLPTRKSCKSIGVILQSIEVRRRRLANKQSAIYWTAALYASSLYVSLTIKESSTVVSQLISSYRYMLGPLSLFGGVHSYSDSPKKSSSLDVITEDIRPIALCMVSWNAGAAVI